MEKDLIGLICQLTDQCHAQGYRITTAESCTGGWLAKTLTDLPGSSHYFESGIITYSNEAKIALLGVSQGTLNRYGAVSKSVAEQMVLGALARNPMAHLAVSITGVAGPGGTESKPVGLVWLGGVRRGDAVHAGEHHFSGDRRAVREQAVHAALVMLCHLATP